MPEGKREDIPGMGAENNSVSTHCSLLLFKSEDEQVLSGAGWFWSKCGKMSRDRHSNTHARTVLLRVFINFTLHVIGVYVGLFFLLPLTLSDRQVSF